MCNPSMLKVTIVILKIDVNSLFSEYLLFVLIYSCENMENVAPMFTSIQCVNTFPIALLNEERPLFYCVQEI